MKRFLLYGFALMFSGCLYSQGLPNTAFPSLNLSSSARLASLGGNFATLPEPDINFAISNPSLVLPSLDHFAMLHYADYFWAYSNLHAAYVRDFQKIGVFLASMQYVNYGSIEAYDESGYYLGPSNPMYEFGLNLGWGKALVDSVFSIGANFKYLFFRGENFFQHGVAVDVSGTYTNIEKRLGVSLGFRNIGTVLKRDLVTEYEKLPFEITMALYQRMQHAPFAYSVVLSNLQRWNLSGVDVNAEEVDEVTGEVTKPNRFSTFADNAMRHIIPGVEVFPFQNFALRLSYNYHRRQELKNSVRPGLVGFSWGVGAKIYKFQIDYARSTYNLAGAPNYITVSANLMDFFK
jgi:hypothetical protein